MRAEWQILRWWEKAVLVVWAVSSLAWILLVVLLGTLVVLEHS